VVRRLTSSYCRWFLHAQISATLKLVDALVAANKDFELLVMPGRDHGFGADPYFVRRRWDFFVKHLMGVVEPPGRDEVSQLSAELVF
jgi:dipeptidyl-peptidase-4